MNNELFNSQKFQNDLKSNLKKILNSLLDNKKYEMNFEFEITNDIKLLVKNLITNEDIDFENTMNINDFLNVIIDRTINNTNYDVLTQYNPTQLCALSGINLDKEYNNIMEEANVEYNISLFGGGGSLPSKPIIPEFGKPNNVDLHNITIKQYYDDVLSQNEYYQYNFLHAYSIALPVFILLNFILHCLNISSLGAMSILIAQTTIDITFLGLQIYNCVKNYNNTKNTKKAINNIIEKASEFDELSFIISWGTYTSIILFGGLDVIDLYINVKNAVKDFGSFHKLLLKNLKITISIARVSLSILSLAFTITMTILEETLIK